MGRALAGEVGTGGYSIYVLCGGEARHPGQRFVGLVIQGLAGKRVRAHFIARPGIAHRARGKRGLDRQG